MARIEPARFLFVTWDGGGNVPPELAIARRLADRGHQVRVLCDPTLEPEVRAANCEHAAWKTAPHRTTRDRSGDIIRDYEKKSMPRMIRDYMDTFLGGPAPRWAGDTFAELDAHPADLMVADAYIPATLIAAEKLRIPTVSLVPNIWFIPTPGIPTFGPGLAPARGPLGRLRDTLMRAMVGRAFSSALPGINSARVGMGLEPLRNFYQQMLRADEIYVLTSPAFDLTSPAMPANVRYVGPLLDDPTWSVAWQDEGSSNDNRPLVLVALSTTFQDQVAVLRRIVEALSTLPVRAVVTLGYAVDPSEVTARTMSLSCVRRHTDHSFSVRLW